MIRFAYSVHDDLAITMGFSGAPDPGCSIRGGDAAGAPYYVKETTGNGGGHSLGAGDRDRPRKDTSVVIP